MQYIAQTVDCAGIPRTETNSEPEIVEDDSEPEYPLVCSQCDHFRVWGACALTSFKRKASSLACPEIKVTCPF